MEKFYAVKIGNCYIKFFKPFHLYTVVESKDQATGFYSEYAAKEYIRDYNLHNVEVELISHFIFE